MHKKFKCEFIIDKATLCWIVSACARFLFSSAQWWDLPSFCPVNYYSHYSEFTGQKTGKIDHCAAATAYRKRSPYFQNSWNLGPARVPVDSKTATNRYHFKKRYSNSILEEYISYLFITFISLFFSFWLTKMARSWTFNVNCKTFPGEIVCITG